MLCWLLQGVSVAVLANVWNDEAGYCRVALLVYAIIICVVLTVFYYQYCVGF